MVLDVEQNTDQIERVDGQVLDQSRFSDDQHMGRDSGGQADSFGHLVDKSILHHEIHLLRMRALLVPPNPKEALITVFTRAARASPGT